MGDVVAAVCQEDTSPLTHTIRLHYQGHRRLPLLRTRHVIINLRISALISQRASSVAPLRRHNVFLIPRFVLMHDPLLNLALQVLAQLAGFYRPAPGAGKELELVWEHLAHAFEIPC